jgi:hypothetical protein
MEKSVLDVGWWGGRLGVAGIGALALLPLHMGLCLVYSARTPMLLRPCLCDANVGSFADGGLTKTKHWQGCYGMRCHFVCEI